MTELNRALSAYSPAIAHARPAEIDFALPLQVYIIETIERDARSKLLRQISLVAALVVGVFVCQWPAAFNAANAVTTMAVAGSSTPQRIAGPVLVERLAFAPKLSADVR